MPRRAPIALFFAALCFSAAAMVASAQPAPQALISGSDIDRDGLPDDLEQTLLQQFLPLFMLDQADCAGTPAAFVPGEPKPKVESVNGTIYGQVFPAKTSAAHIATAVEIHFYHLWRQDCGAHGHPLDAEHVSALVEPSGADLAKATWKATWWFAAAHEDTVCNVSQIARAVALHAESQGAMIWVSSGKHASFLNGSQVGHGCGKDRVGNADALSVASVVNIGEPGFPMNGAVWAASGAWPLAGKMSQTDFPAIVTARVEALSSISVLPAASGRHPMQGVIAISGTTAGALESSRKDTADAIDRARNSTGSALGKGYRSAANGISNALDRTAGYLRLR